MSEHKKIEELLTFYVITACQDMEDEDLFEGKGDSSEDEENELVMLGLTSLLGTRYLEQRSFHVVKSKHWYHHILPKYDDCRFKAIRGVPEMTSFPEGGRGCQARMTYHF